MEYLAQACLLIVAVIHLLPSVGVLGPARLFTLYGVPTSEPNLELLLRHRAVLFGIVGLLLLASVVVAPLRPAALLVGLGSVVSFLVLARRVGPINAQLSRVAIVDIVALVLLGVASVVELTMR